MSLKEYEDVRLNLIWDALMGIDYHLPDPEILLYPFLDCILLLHQKKIVLSIWKNDKCIDVFLKDPIFLGENEVAKDKQKELSIQEKERFLREKFCREAEKTTDLSCLVSLTAEHSLAIHLFPNSGGISKLGSIDEGATDLTRKLFGNYHAEMTKNFLIQLGESIEKHAKRLEINEETSPGSNIAEEEVLSYLAPMKEALNNIFKDLINSKGELSLSKSGMPNIFIAARTYTIDIENSTVRGVDFGYTVRILLLKKAKERLTKWCSDNCPNLSDNSPSDCLSLFEQPVGPHVRTIADLVFSSGLVAFGLRPQDKKLDTLALSEKDKRSLANSTAADVENCIYPADSSLFYIPIHVCGTPWLAMFTLAEKDPTKDWVAWHHNYIFYRQVIQKVAELIRHKSTDVYINLVVDILVKNLRSWVRSKSDSADSANKELEKISKIYPFPRLLIVDDITSKEKIHFRGRGDFRVRFLDNKFFPRQVSYESFNGLELLEKVQRLLDDYISREEFINISSVAQMSHLLKTPLNRLSALIDKGDMKALGNLAEKIKTLHEATSAWLSEEKRIDLIVNYEMKEKINYFYSYIKSELKEILTSLSSDPRIKPNLKNFDLDVDKILVIPEEKSLQNNNVKFFKPLAFALMDGLISNAILNIDKKKPYLAVRFYREKDFLYMEVENSVSGSEDRIRRRLERCNSPRPDLVGITEIHWMTMVFWRRPSGNEERPSWRLEEKGKNKYVVARVLIAEVCI